MFVAYQDVIYQNLYTYKKSTTIKFIGVWPLKLWQGEIADNQKNTIFVE